MAVKCTECGYENTPEYRFCGMCGAPLPMAGRGEKPKAAEWHDSVPTKPAAVRPLPAKPAPLDPAPAQQVEERAPLRSPSFLGLDQEAPARSADYLLEDDEPRSGRGWILIVLLLAAVVGGLAYWQWMRNGGFSLQRAPSSAANSNPSTPQNPGDGSTASDAGTGNPGPSSATSASPTPTSATLASPAAAQGPTAATTTPQGTPSAAAAPGTPPPSPTDAQATTSDNQKPGASSEAAAPSVNPGAPPTAAPLADRVVAPPKEEAMPTPSAAPQPNHHSEAAAPARPAKPTPSRKAALAENSSKQDEDEALVVQGERYLHGNGVGQNCDLAQRSLLTAAGHNNVRALSVLGTMYATGHCATRDLPSAYRWFAKALHQDPGNSRISTDLEVIWKQMTPAERTAATRSGQ
jgi:zinc-ribbon domain